MRLSRTTFAALAGLALVASACSGGGSGGSAGPSPTGEAQPGVLGAAPAQGEADLVIWTAAREAPAVRSIAARFAVDKGLTVEVQVVPADLQARFLTANAEGRGPDVLTGAHDWIGDLVRSRAISPLQITADKLAEYADVSVEAVTHQGRIYALPFGLEALALYRNTDVVPAEPSTLDEAIDAGEAAVAAGRVESALNLSQGQTGDAYSMEPVLTSMGGYVFGTTAAGEYNPDDLGIGKPGSIAAAKKIYDLGERGRGVLRRSVAGDDGVASFAAGRAAFLISGPWALPAIRAAGVSYAITPIPPFAGHGPARPFTGVQVFYVASRGRGIGLAQDFLLNAVNGEESMRALYDGVSLPPAMNVVAAKVGAADPDIAALTDAATMGDPTPALPAMHEVWAPLGRAYAAVIAGGDPAATMTRAGLEISASIG